MGLRFTELVRNLRLRVLFSGLRLGLKGKESRQVEERIVFFVEAKSELLPA